MLIKSTDKKLRIFETKTVFYSLQQETKISVTINTIKKHGKVLGYP